VDLIIAAEFRKLSQKRNLSAVRAVVRVVAIMVKVRIVGEIDSVRAIGVHRPKVKGRDSVRSVRREDELRPVGAIGCVEIVD
jgi:hypothetical protein